MRVHVSSARLLLFMLMGMFIRVISRQDKTILQATYFIIQLRITMDIIMRAKKRMKLKQNNLKSLDDDPNQILTLFPRLRYATLAKTYSKDTEEIIKMASLSIQRHPNSKWVDENYILVGKAQTFMVVTFKMPFKHSNM
ncbi:MAG: hypothetical protein U5K54_28890 [Cytophagales bacterium]|nr:hypothetical protein [Cytophagales bacterium]